jgi:hypothetical protein
MSRPTYSTLFCYRMLWNVEGFCSMQQLCQSTSYRRMQFSDSSDPLCRESYCGSHSLKGLMSNLWIACDNALYTVHYHMQFTGSATMIAVAIKKIYDLMLSLPYTLIIISQTISRVSWLKTDVSGTSSIPFIRIQCNSLFTPSHTHMPTQHLCSKLSMKQWGLVGRVKC